MDVLRCLVMSKRFLLRLLEFAVIVCTLQNHYSSAILPTAKLKSKQNLLCSPPFSTRKTSFVISAKAEKKIVVTETTLPVTTNQQQVFSGPEGAVDVNSAEIDELFRSRLELLTPNTDLIMSDDALDVKSDYLTIVEEEITMAEIASVPYEIFDDKPIVLAGVSKSKKQKTKDTKEINQKEVLKSDEDLGLPVDNLFGEIVQNDLSPLEVVEDVVPSVIISDVESEIKEKIMKTEKTKKKKDVVEPSALEGDLMSEVANIIDESSLDASNEVLDTLAIIKQTSSEEARPLVEDKGIDKNRELKDIDTKPVLMITILETANDLTQTSDLNPNISKGIISQESSQAELPQNPEDELNVKDYNKEDSLTKQMKPHFTATNNELQENVNEYLNGNEEDTDLEDIAKMKLFGGGFWDPFMDDFYPEDIDIFGALKLSEDLCLEKEIYSGENDDNSLNSGSGSGENTAEKISTSTLNEMISLNFEGAEVGSTDLADVVLYSARLSNILLLMEEKIQSLEDELQDEKHRSTQLIQAFLKMEIEQDALRADFGRLMGDRQQVAEEP